MQKCKAGGEGEENTEHCGRTIYTALVGGGERGCTYYQPWCSGPATYNYLYSSDSGHALLYAIKIIIALQIG